MGGLPTGLTRSLDCGLVYRRNVRWGARTRSRGRLVAIQRQDGMLACNWYCLLRKQCRHCQVFRPNRTSPTLWHCAHCWHAKQSVGSLHALCRGHTGAQHYWQGHWDCIQAQVRHPARLPALHDVHCAPFAPMDDCHGNDRRPPQDPR